MDVNNKAAESTSVKYLSVVTDSKLKFDENDTDTQNGSSNKSLSKKLDGENKNTIVIGHVHFSALLVVGLEETLIVTLIVVGKNELGNNYKF